MSAQDKCRQCRFLQTNDMLYLYVFFFFIIQISFLFNGVMVVRLRHIDHLLRVRKISCIGLKYLLWVPETHPEMFSFLKNRCFFCFFVFFCFTFLYVASLNIFRFTFYFILWHHCAYCLVWLRRKNYLVSAGKRSYFGLKYPYKHKWKCSQGPLKIDQWCHANKS